MGWPAEPDGPAVALRLGGGIVALEVPTTWAPAVRRSLERIGQCTPALVRTSCEPCAVFLAEADNTVLGQCDVPGNTKFLTAPMTLRLPVLPAAESSDTFWYCTPDSGHRWLFPAHTVLTAVRAAVPGSGGDHAKPRRSGNRLLIG